MTDSEPESRIPRLFVYGRQKHVVVLIPSSVISVQVSEGMAGCRIVACGRTDYGGKAQAAVSQTYQVPDDLYDVVLWWSGHALVSPKAKASGELPF